MDMSIQTEGPLAKRLESPDGGASMMKMMGGGPAPTTSSRSRSHGVAMRWQR